MKRFLRNLKLSFKNCTTLYRLLFQNKLYMNCPSQPTLRRQSPTWLPGPLDERARTRAQPARHVPSRGWGLLRKGGGKGGGVGGLGGGGGGGMGGGIQEGVIKRFLNSWSGLGSQLLSREQSPDFNETSKSGRWLGFPREWGVEPVPHTDKVARSARLALDTKVGATVVQESTNKGIYGVLYFLVSSGGTGSPASTINWYLYLLQC